MHAHPILYLHPLLSTQPHPCFIGSMPMFIVETNPLMLYSQCAHLVFDYGHMSYWFSGDGA